MDEGFVLGATANLKVYGPATPSGKSKNEKSTGATRTAGSRPG